MRIALLSWESLHSIRVGGCAVHVTELAAALERRGHDIHVFTRIGPGQSSDERIYGVHYHRCSFDLHPSFVDEVNSMCRSFVHQVFEAERSGGPFDVIHAHDWLAANAMIWIRQGGTRRGIMTVHSTEYGRCGNALGDGQSERIRHQEFAGVYWADHVVAVSHALKTEIERMYQVPEEKISVIYNGVNVHNYDGWIEPAQVKRRYDIGPVDPTVLFAGRITYQKGPDHLVEAVPSIVKFYPHAKFVFAGDGEMRQSLEKRAGELSVGDAIRFVGFQTDSSLVNLFKACDVVCVPSRNEPFGIVILEAWSAGKPVVSTRNGGPDEFVWHEVNGLKIHADPNSVAWGLGTLFADFDRARWMGSNGRKAAETAFTWDAIAEQTLGVYSS